MKIRMMVAAIALSSMFGLSAMESDMESVESVELGSVLGMSAVDGDKVE